MPVKFSQTVSLHLALCGCCFLLNSGFSAEESVPAKGLPYSVQGRTTRGREVHARGDVPLKVQVSGDTVAVTLGRHLLKVEKQELSIDGGHPLKIPATDQAIEVTCTNNTLLVTAGGQRIFSGRFDKGGIRRQSGGAK